MQYTSINDEHILAAIRMFLRDEDSIIIGKNAQFDKTTVFCKHCIIEVSRRSVNTNVDINSPHAYLIFRFVAAFDNGIEAFKYFSTLETNVPICYILASKVEVANQSCWNFDLSRIDLKKFEQ